MNRKLKKKIKPSTARKADKRALELYNDDRIALQCGLRTSNIYKHVNAKRNRVMRSNLAAA